MSYWNVQNGNMPPTSGFSQAQGSYGYGFPTQQAYYPQAVATPPAPQPATQQSSAASALEDQFISSLLQQQPPKKLTFGDVVSSFAKGAVVDTLKGIFSLPGIASMLGCGALIAIAGPAVLPFLAAFGIATGGFGAATGFMSAMGAAARGDTEGAKNAIRGIGSNTVAMLTSIFGIRSFYKNSAIQTTNAGNKGMFGRLWQDITGKSEVVGTGKNLFGVMKDTSATNIGKLRLSAKNLFSNPQSVLEGIDGNIKKVNADIAEARKAGNSRRVTQLQEKLKRLETDRQSQMKRMNQEAETLKLASQDQTKIKRLNDDIAQLEEQKIKAVTTTKKNEIQAKIDAKQAQINDVMLKSLPKTEAAMKRYADSSEEVANLRNKVAAEEARAGNLDADVANTSSGKRLAKLKQESSKLTGQNKSTQKSLDKAMAKLKNKLNPLEQQSLDDIVANASKNNGKISTQDQKVLDALLQDTSKGLSQSDVDQAIRLQVELDKGIARKAKIDGDDGLIAKAEKALKKSDAARAVIDNTKAGRKLQEVNNQVRALRRKKAAAEETVKKYENASNLGEAERTKLETAQKVLLDLTAAEEQQATLVKQTREMIKVDKPTRGIVSLDEARGQLRAAEAKQAKLLQEMELAYLQEYGPGYRSKMPADIQEILAQRDIAEKQAFIQERTPPANKRQKAEVEAAQKDIERLQARQEEKPIFNMDVDFQANGGEIPTVAAAAIQTGTLGGLVQQFDRSDSPFRIPS